MLILALNSALHFYPESQKLDLSSVVQGSGRLKLMDRIVRHCTRLRTFAGNYVTHVAVLVHISHIAEQPNIDTLTVKTREPCLVY